MLCPPHHAPLCPNAPGDHSTRDVAATRTSEPGAMTTGRAPTRWMVAVAALALLAAACGDDDDGAAVPPTNESAAAETQSDSVEVDEAALQAILDQWRTGVGADGATLSLRVPGHDDIHLASGIDDRDPDTPMPTDGTFGIASVTKTFVAALALQLVDGASCPSTSPSPPGSPSSRTPTRSPLPCCTATPPASVHLTSGERRRGGRGRGAGRPGNDRHLPTSPGAGRGVKRGGRCGQAPHPRGPGSRGDRPGSDRARAWHAGRAVVGTDDGVADPREAVSLASPPRSRPSPPSPARRSPPSPDCPTPSTNAPLSPGGEGGASRSGRVLPRERR
jgi:hypothetical protein